MNRKTLFIVLLIYILVFSALLFKKGEVALMALPFLSYLVIGLLQTPREVKLSASRWLSKTTALAGVDVEVRVTLKNEGAPLYNLSLSDSTFPGLPITRRQAEQQLRLSSGGESELCYSLQTRRGVYHWETLHAAASDPFGLFTTQIEVSAGGYLLVQPEISRLRHIPLRPRSTLHSAGSIPARIAGSGTDFWGVREYQAGDSFRHLNWRMTARNPHKLFTREYEQEEITDIGLILDTRISPDFVGNVDAFFDHMVSAAASLAEVFLREGNRVGLLVYGEHIAYLFPGYGKHQLNNVLSALARATPDSYFSFSNLAHICARLFPSRSQLIFLSPLVSQDTQIYTRLRAYGYQILLISPDPVEFYARQVSPGPTNELAVRAARIERRLQLKQILQKGAQVIDWPVERSLNEVIHGALRKI